MLRRCVVVAHLMAALAHLIENLHETSRLPGGLKLQCIDEFMCACFHVLYGYCQAAKKANNTFAAFSAARFMKVLISFSPSPPPARSLRERKAMNGTPLL